MAGNSDNLSKEIYVEIGKDLDMESKNLINKIEVEEFLRKSCSTQFVTRSYNCDGSSTPSITAYLTYECGASQPEGEHTVIISHVDGCPLGPGPRPEYP